MNFYLDTEFIETAKQRRLLGFPVGKPVPTIDLISIGIVAEDGREYYALNADCELAYAWANKWVRDHVLRPIWESYQDEGRWMAFPTFTLLDVQRLFRQCGRTTAQLRAELIRFVFPLSHLANQLGGGAFVSADDCLDADAWIYVGIGSPLPRAEAVDFLLRENTLDLPRFFAYFGDYDWVVFCQLFGQMIDLPNGFPQVCYDLKQEMDRIGMSKVDKRVLCPDPVDEHNALADARWARDFHRMLREYAVKVIGTARHGLLF